MGFRRSRGPGSQVDLKKYFRTFVSGMIWRGFLGPGSLHELQLLDQAGSKPKELGCYEPPKRCRTLKNQPPGTKLR